MIIRNINDIKARGAYAEKPGIWTSARYLLRDDDVGFTLTQTTVAAGQSFEMEYKNHVEANLVIKGTATVTNIENGEQFELVTGSMYTLDNHERHQLDVHTDLHLVCVFSPALTGQETHDADGSYPVL